MKYRLMIIVVCATFVCTTSLLVAQNAEVAHTCTGSWVPMPAKVPGSKVVLSLITTKEGKQQLQWSAHKMELVTRYVRKAKGTANAKGEIEVCAEFQATYTFTDQNSISLRDLIKDNKLQLGYYAIRVKIGDQNSPGETSDWITIQIK